MEYRKTLPGSSLSSICMNCVVKHIYALIKLEADLTAAHKYKSRKNRHKRREEQETLSSDVREQPAASTLRLHDLPPHLKLMILETISHVHSVIWREELLQLLSESILEIDLDRLTCLTALPTKTLIKEMTRRCPKLLRFSVGEQGLMDIYPADVKHIAEKCSQLTILNLRGCVMAVNDQSLDRISIAGCVQVTDRAMIGIASKCKNLIVLDIRGCINITDEGHVAVLEGCSTSIQEILS